MKMLITPSRSNLRDFSNWFSWILYLNKQERIALYNFYIRYIQTYKSILYLNLSIEKLTMYKNILFVINELVDSNRIREIEGVLQE